MVNWGRFFGKKEKKGFKKLRIVKNPDYTPWPGNTIPCPSSDNTLYGVTRPEREARPLEEITAKPGDLYREYANDEEKKQAERMAETSRVRAILDTMDAKPRKQKKRKGYQVPKKENWFRKHGSALLTVGAIAGVLGIMEAKHKGIANRIEHMRTKNENQVVQQVQEPIYEEPIYDERAEIAIQSKLPAVESAVQEILPTVKRTIEEGDNATTVLNKVLREHFTGYMPERIYSEQGQQGYRVLSPDGIERSPNNIYPGDTIVIQLENYVLREDEWQGWNVSDDTLEDVLDNLSYEKDSVKKFKSRQDAYQESLLEIGERYAAGERVESIRQDMAAETLRDKAYIRKLGRANMEKTRANFESERFDRKAYSFDMGMLAADLYTESSEMTYSKVREKLMNMTCEDARARGYDTEGEGLLLKSDISESYIGKMARSYVS